jgi:hypothetical protein
LHRARDPGVRPYAEVRMRSFIFATFALCAPLADAGNVHIVGGPASTAATIQLAIDAAVEGDVVLVRTTPLASFVVDGKSLTIVGEIAGARVDSLVEIRNVGAAQMVALRDLELHSLTTDTLYVHDCAGHVRFDGVTVRVDPLPGSFKHAVRVVNCADVAFAHSDLTGSPGVGSASNAGNALWARNSNIGLDVCAVRGGEGTNGSFSAQLSISPSARAAAIHLETGAQLRLQGCDVSGGEGGSGVSGTCCCTFPHGAGPGAAGGKGIESLVSTSVSVIDTLVVGGDGGVGGSGQASCNVNPGTPGAAGAPTSNVTLVAATGVRRTLTADALTREQQTLDLVVKGAPGEVATLLMSSTSQLNSVPGIQGAVLVGPAFRRIALGIVPGSGVLNASLPLGDLAPGVQGSRRFLQAFCRDANGQVRMTGCASVAFLDAAF